MTKYPADSFSLSSRCHLLFVYSISYKMLMFSSAFNNSGEVLNLYYDYDSLIGELFEKIPLFHPMSAFG